jgi:hypothetical protein
VSIIGLFQIHQNPAKPGQAGPEKIKEKRLLLLGFSCPF